MDDEKTIVTLREDLRKAIRCVERSEELLMDQRNLHYSKHQDEGAIKEYRRMIDTIITEVIEQMCKYD